MTDLRKAIEQFDIDGRVTAFPFAERLARENRWSRLYAERVVREYKRFVYLMATAGKPMTPSDAVDQAWHLHLSYTASYWDRLCGQIIGRPLHHHPTAGGDAEAKKYDRQYDDTLKTYRETFGEDAPQDIWPTSEIRFSAASDGVRVMPGESWVVPKKMVIRTAVGLAGAIAIAVSIGCVGGLNPFELDGKSYLSFFIPTFLLTVLLGILYRFWAAGPGLPPGEELPDLRWDQLAYLTGGTNRLLTATMTRLVERGYAKVNEHNGEELQKIGGDGQPLLPVENAVWNRLPVFKLDRAAMNKLAIEAEAAIASDVHDLEEKGWLRSGTKTTGIALMSVLPLVIFTAIFGFGRLIQGIQNNKPVGYLVILLVIAFITFLVMMFSQSRWTRAGRQIVDGYRKRHSRLQNSGNFEEAALPQGATAATAVALFGTGCLVGSAYGSLSAWYPNRRDSGDGGYYFASGCGTGCGSSGGDGGGGDGGGGGGCGGCGGGGD